MIKKFNINPHLLRGKNTKGGILQYAEYILENARAPKESSFLDIGCGDGMVLQCISKLRPDLNLYGIDLSSNLIELASNLLPNAHFDVANVLEGVPFKTKFDRIISFSVGQYFSEDQFIRLNKNLIKNISSFGKIIHFSIPDQRMWLPSYISENVRHNSGLYSLIKGAIRYLTKPKPYSYGEDSYWHSPLQVKNHLEPLFDIEIISPSDSWYRFDLSLSPKSEYRSR